MSVTIRDIAEHTGLAISTISKYLNGGNVLPENQEKIKKAVETLNFQVNPFARSMKTNRSYVIGIVNSSTQNSYIKELIGLLKDEFREFSYICAVVNCEHTEEAQKKAVEFLLSRNIDALIFIDMLVSMDPFSLSQVRPIPVLAIGAHPNYESVDQIKVDDFSALNSAVRFMARKINNILYLEGNEDYHQTRERLRGYKAGLEKAGLSFDQSYISQGEVNPESAYQRMKVLLEQHPEARGIIVGDSDLLIGAYMAITEKGLRVPDDICVTSFANKDMPKTILESMNILQLPLQKICASVCKMVMDKIEENEDIYQRVMFPYELVIGNE